MNNMYLAASHVRYKGLADTMAGCALLTVQVVFTC